MLDVLQASPVCPRERRDFRDYPNDPDDYELLEELGKGASATVRIATAWRTDMALYTACMALTQTLDAESEGLRLLLAPTCFPAALFEIAAVVPTVRKTRQCSCLRPPSHRNLEGEPDTCRRCIWRTAGHTTRRSR